MLSQLLSVAAAATAASLTRHRQGASPGQAQIRANGQDNGFDQFLTLLQRGRLMAALRGDRPDSESSETTESGVAEMPTPNGPQMNMFRMFRFGTITPSETSSDEEDAPRELVPIIIVGIRSVTPREAEHELGVDNDGDAQNNEVDVDRDRDRIDNNPPSEARSHDMDVDEQPANHATSGSEPMPEAVPRQPNARSWIIYVVGGTYPANHPILTTPSLFTDNPSYEDMLMLDMLAHVRPPVTTQAALDKSNEVRIITVGDLASEIPEARKCQICLSEYEDDDVTEQLRVLACRHVFHKTCVDKWLTEGSNKCPLCRDVAIKAKSATPLAATAPIPVDTTDTNDTMQGVEEHR